MHPITIKDVAREAGVGVSTVSMALRNHPDIARATCERVQAIAAKIGYRKNAAFAILGSRGKGGRSARLPGLALITALKGPLRSGNSMDYWRAFPELAEPLGYHAERVNLESGDCEELARQLGILHARGVSGLVIGLHRLPEGWERLDWSRFSVVSLASGVTSSVFHEVRRAHFEDWRRAWKLGLQRGYRRIGAAPFQHLHLPEDDWERIGAVLSMLEEQRLTHPEVTVVPPFRGAHDDEAGFLQWYRDHRPDAVIGFHLKIYWWLKDAGLRIPGKVGVVTMHMQTDARDRDDDIPMSGFIWQPALAARAAIDRLDAMLKRSESGIPDLPHVIRVPCLWWEGATI